MLGAVSPWLAATTAPFKYPSNKPTLAFQPDLPHTAPPVPCNQTCRTFWSRRAAVGATRARWLDGQAQPLELDPSNSTAVIGTGLFGYNLELTRHGMFAGLSAQLIANRLFASADGRWPPARWEGVNGPRLDPPGLSGNDGTYSVRCTIGGGHAHLCGVKQRKVLDGFDGGLSGGSSIALVAGRAYTVRLVLRSTATEADRALNMALVVTDEENGDAEVVSHRWAVREGGELWRTREFNFTSGTTTRSAALSIVGQHAGKSKLLVRFWIGAVSLMPSDNVLGARVDVLRLLLRIGFRGPVRWPGGCYSSVAAPWEEGLRPADERPPVRAPPETHFCNAVPGGLQAHTDGFTENWPSIDEYMQLIRFLRAEPAVGMQIQFGSDEEVASGRAFVEYCNGPVSSPMGKLRASRGHPEPYGIKIWYLGNEIGVQGRYPPGQRRGDWAHAVGAASPQEYKEILSRVVPALLAVDSSLQLVAANAVPNVSIPFSPQEKLAAVWNGPYLGAVGGDLWANSHHYYMRQPVEWNPDSMTATGKLANSHALASLQQFRERLDAASAHTSFISLDEWALGPPWSTKRFGVPHAIYGASMLMQIIRRASALKLRSANYYEPINEGAITVGPWNSSLTPLGQVFELLARHQGGRTLSIPEGWRRTDDDDLEVFASIGPGKEAGGRGETADRVLLSVVNRDAIASRSVEVRVTGVRGSSTAAAPSSLTLECFILNAVDIDPVTARRLGDPGRFARHRSSLTAQLRPVVPRRESGGERAEQQRHTVEFRLAVPAYSVVQLEVPLAT